MTTLIYPAGAGFFDARLSPRQRAAMASTAGQGLPQFNTNEYDGTDPYVDPFPGLKGATKVWAVCHACAGSGLYEMPTHITDIEGRPYCFKCEGIGGKVRTVTAARASIRRKIKAHNEREAKLARQQAEYEAGAAARQAREAATAARQAEAHAAAEQRLAQLEVTLPAGTKLHGIPVTVNRTATYMREAYNTWEAPETVAVVTFTDDQAVDYVWHSGSAAAFQLQQGDTGNLFGTVKRASIYRNDAQVTITRARLKDVTPAPDVAE